MTFLDETAWRGRVYSGGWVSPAGGDAAVTEPATGAELGRTGIAVRGATLSEILSGVGGSTVNFGA